MDLASLVLATTLTCHPPANQSVMGLWESTSVSRGGIGHNFEFRDDGSYTTAVTVIVDLNYDIRDGIFYMSHNKTEPINYEKGAKIEINEVGFTLTGENGEKEVKTKELPSKDKTIVGKYKYRHYSGGIAYEKYTSDGTIKFRLPMKSISGCYSIDNDTIILAQAEKELSEIKYKATNDNLTLKSKEGTYSYNSVPEGAWYVSKEIDYQKPPE